MCFTREYTYFKFSKFLPHRSALADAAVTSLLRKQKKLLSLQQLFQKKRSSKTMYQVHIQMYEVGFAECLDIRA